MISELTRHPVVRMTPRRRAKITLLYVRALIAEFKGTLAALSILVLIGAVIHHFTPPALLDGQRVGVGDSIFFTWMALLAQPQFLRGPWYLKTIYGIYPILGFTLIGEGVVRLALLLMSKRLGEKEWMQVAASTYRDHVILCGLGHLGFRVLEHLVMGNVSVVVLERSENNSFVAQAKAMSVPVLIRDMKEDQALIDAGVERAAAIIICSNDELANLEVAIDARRMNKTIRVVMRLFEQQLASKIRGALTIDAAFSSSALAAPVVAAMAFQTKVLSTLNIGGKSYVTAEVCVAVASDAIGKTIAEIEKQYAARVLARAAKGAEVESPPSAQTRLAAEDVLIVHVAAEKIDPVLSMCRARVA